MRGFHVCVLLAALAVAACAGVGGGAGEPADEFVTPEVEDAYIPLHQSTLLGERFGAATVILPGIAATNAHNANLVDEKDDLGRSPSGYDMMFFHTDRQLPPKMGEPQPGEMVILYGQGTGGSLRMAQGAVHLIGPYSFTIAANAGKGFSGGPVVDAKDGHLVGITYGFMDMKDQGGQRAMYAFRISSVMAEYAALKRQGFHDELKDFSRDFGAQ